MARLEIDLQARGFKEVASQAGQVNKALGSLESTSAVVSKNIQTLTNSSNQLEGRLAALRSQFASGAISQSQYEKSSKGLGIAIENVRGRIGQLQSQQRSLTATLSQASTAATQQGAALNRLNGYHQSFSSGVRSSNTIAVEFSRIIQDAPYGLQGVANNVQQLTQNYANYARAVQDAAAQQGKSLTSFQVLRGAVSSFASPLNLLTIGISLVTAGFVAYEKWTQRSAKATKEAEKANVSYIETLTGIARAQANGQADALKELTTVEQLYKATQNVNIPLKDRIENAKELIKQGKGVFESTTAEAIVTGKASDAYDKLTVSIRQTAMAQAYMQKITDNATTALNNNLQILNQANEILKLNQQIQQTEANLNTRAAGASVGASSAAEYKTIARLEQQRADRVKQITDLNKANSTVLKEQDLLQKGINASLENGGSLISGGGNGGISGGLKEVSKSLKEISSLTDTVVRDSLSQYDARLLDISRKYDEIFAKVSNPNILGLASVNKEAEILRATFDRLNDTVDKLKNAKINIIGQITTPSSLPGLAGASESINRPRTSNLGDVDPKLEERFSKAVERGLRNGFSDIFNSIDDLGSNFFEVFSGVFGKLASTVTNTFGQVIATQLGDLLSKRISDEEFSVAGLGSTASKAVVAGGGLLGGILSSQGQKKANTGLSIAGGALSGAAAGFALGPIGAAVGGVIGAISGIFASAGARRQEKIQEAQLAEQRKQTALQERQAALSYSSSIIGRMSNQGIVSGSDINEFGEVTFRIQGKDLVASLNRENNSR